MNDIYEVGSY